MERIVNSVVEDVRNPWYYKMLLALGRRLGGNTTYEFLMGPLRSWVFCDEAAAAFEEFKLEFLEKYFEDQRDWIYLADPQIVDAYSDQHEDRVDEWKNPPVCRNHWAWQDHVLRFCERLTSYSQEVAIRQEFPDWTFIPDAIIASEFTYHAALLGVLDIWMSHWVDTNDLRARNTMCLTQTEISEFVEGYDSEEEIAGNVLRPISLEFQRNSPYNLDDPMYNLEYLVLDHETNGYVMRRISPGVGTNTTEGHDFWTDNDSNQDETTIAEEI